MHNNNSFNNRFKSQNVNIYSDNILARFIKRKIFTFSKPAPALLRWLTQCHDFTFHFKTVIAHKTENFELIFQNESSCMVCKANWVLSLHLFFFNIYLSVAALIMNSSMIWIWSTLPLWPWNDKTTLPVLRS